MRAFYLSFPIRDAIRHELSWPLYRLLCRLDTEAKRNHYLQESIDANWNISALQKQIKCLALLEPKLTKYHLINFSNSSNVN